MARWGPACACAAPRLPEHSAGLHFHYSTQEKWHLFLRVKVKVNLGKLFF